MWVYFRYFGTDNDILYKSLIRMIKSKSEYGLRFLNLSQKMI